jgi:hypothetical protein
MLRLSLRDRDRLVVLRQVAEGALRPCRGAERLGVSRRHFRRLRRRFEAEGDIAVIHHARGRPSNHRIPEAIRQRVLERAGEKLFQDFGPTLLAEHLARDPEIGPLNAHTLRRWLIEAGRWKTRSRGARHRKARPRRAAFGELVQLDVSDHAWFEDRATGRQGLIKAIDDATGRLPLARLVPRETGPALRQFLIDYLKRYGRPLAFYTDQAGHFGNARRHPSRLPLEEREARQTRSIIRRALEALGIELILARSPQAKGRIERAFGTSQDRLVKELRLAAISSFEEGNRFLEETYMPFWDERFAKAPADPTDTHRPLPEGVDLQRLFAETEERVISNDFTIRYDNRKLQIPQQEAEGIRPKQKITVERRLDGTTRFRWQERYLTLEPVGEFWSRGPQYNTPKRAVPSSRTTAPKRKPPSGNGRRPPPKPGPDHPWRKYPIRVGRGRFQPPRAEASAPAALRPDSPALGTPKP